MEGNLQHEELSGRIIKVFYVVYNELGYGFTEKLYERAMAIALAEEGLKAESQAVYRVFFHEQMIGEYCVDLLVENLIILELKAAACIIEAHEAQLLSYLKASDIEVGLILNFGPRPEIKRLAFANERKFPKKTAFEKKN